MLEQLKRPQLEAPEPRRLAPPPLKPATEPAMPMPSVFTQPLERPAQKKQRKACPACEEEGTTCAGCQKKAAPALERPPASTQMRRGTPGEDPAERQADELGKEIGDELKGTESVGHGPLPKSVQDVAERHLGVSLEGTYVDAGSAGQKKATDESALAVTEGKRIAFGEGQLDASSSEGRALLGHELVHVAQQERAGSRSPMRKPAAAQAPRAAILGRISRLVASKAPADLRKMLRGINLAAGGTKTIKKLSVQGKTHEFALVLQWQRSPGVSSTSPVKTARASDHVVKHVVTMTVAWAPQSGDVPEHLLNPATGKKYPYFELKTNIDRLAWIAAEKLVHETAHAEIKLARAMDVVSPGASAGLSTAEEYEKLVACLNTPALQQARKNLEWKTKLLGSTAEEILVANHAGHVKHAALAAVAGSLSDFLVNERFVRQRTGQPFGYVPADPELARAYIQIAAEGMVRQSVSSPATTIPLLRSDPHWGSAINDVAIAAVKLFHALDAAKHAPCATGELMPSPSWRAAGAPPRPLEIGGQPSKPE